MPVQLLATAFTKCCICHSTAHLLEILLSERARPMYLTKNRLDEIEARLLGRRIGLGPANQIILVSTEWSSPTTCFPLSSGSHHTRD